MASATKSASKTKSASARRTRRTGRRDPLAIRLLKAEHREVEGMFDEYEQLEAAQGDGCAVCGQRPPEPKVLHVDHRHSDGRVRGLLCSNCNTALGLLREDSEVIERLALYAAH